MGVGLDKSQVDYFELNNSDSENILEKLVVANDIDELDKLCKR